MLKKIALAAAVAASASFATYNFFPVGNAMSGQAEIGAAYNWHDHWSKFEAVVDGEFVPVQNLEISLQSIGYQIWNEDDRCDDKGFDKCPDNSGLKALTLGARYQFMPILIAALDLQIPLNSEDVVGKYDPFGVYAAIQFTKEFIPGLALGSELGFDWFFEDEDFEDGLLMKVKAELDYTIASVGLTPWIGLEFDAQLTEDQVDGHDFGGDENQFTFYVGAGYNITKMFGVKANFVISNGDLYGDSMGVNGKFYINF